MRRILVSGVFICLYAYACTHTALGQDQPPVDPSTGEISYDHPDKVDFEKMLKAHETDLRKAKEEYLRKERREHLQLDLAAEPQQRSEDQKAEELKERIHASVLKNSAQPVISEDDLRQRAINQQLNQIEQEIEAQRS